VTSSAHFDDLNNTQRLTLFTFAMLSQEPPIRRRAVVAEGLFSHLHGCLEEEIEAFCSEEGSVDPCFMPLIADEDHPDLTVTAILAADGSIAPIVPHESECFPLILGSGVYSPRQTADKNPYTILQSEQYGEEHEGAPRRVVILAGINAERASYFGTEPMMVVLDFDFAGDDAPRLYEFPLDFGAALSKLDLGQALSRLRATDPIR